MEILTCDYCGGEFEETELHVTTDEMVVCAECTHRDVIEVK